MLWSVTQCDVVEPCSFRFQGSLSTNSYMNKYSEYTNRTSFADLNATGIKNMELFYVTLYRLVIKVSEKFGVFFHTVKGFFVSSRPPTEMDPLTNRCENHKTPG